MIRKPISPKLRETVHDYVRENGHLTTKVECWKHLIASGVDCKFWLVEEAYVENNVPCKGMHRADARKAVTDHMWHEETIQQCIKLMDDPDLDRKADEILSRQTQLNRMSLDERVIVTARSCRDGLKVLRAPKKSNVVHISDYR